MMFTGRKRFLACATELELASPITDESESLAPGLGFSPSLLSYSLTPSTTAAAVEGSKMGYRVLTALCHKRSTSAIRLLGATSIFSAELHAILLALDVVRRSKERHFLLLSDSYSSLIALGGSRVDQDTIYKYLITYSTLTNW